MTIVVVLALMIVAYFIPEDRRLRAMRAMSATSPPPEATMSRSRAPTNAACAWRGALGAVAGGLVLAAFFLMVTKPGL